MKRLLLGSLLTGALVFALAGADKATTKGTASSKHASPKGKKHQKDKKGNSGPTTPPPK